MSVKVADQVIPRLTELDEACARSIQSAVKTREAVEPQIVAAFDKMNTWNGRVGAVNTKLQQTQWTDLYSHLGRGKMGTEIAKELRELKERVDRGDVAVPVGELPSELTSILQKMSEMFRGSFCGFEGSYEQAHALEKVMRCERANLSRLSDMAGAYGEIAEELRARVEQIQKRCAEGLSQLGDSLRNLESQHKNFKKQLDTTRDTYGRFCCHVYHKGPIPQWKFLRKFAGWVATGEHKAFEALEEETQEGVREPAAPPRKSYCAAAKSAMTLGTT